MTIETLRAIDVKGEDGAMRRLAFAKLVFVS